MGRKKNQSSVKIDEHHKIIDTNSSQMSASWKSKDKGRKTVPYSRRLKEIQQLDPWLVDLELLSF